MKKAFRKTWCYAGVLAMVMLGCTVTYAEVRTVVFQNGLNGYTGVKDTYVRSLTPDDNYSESTVVWIDSEISSTEGGMNIGLLKFENIIGNGMNQIPEGANILNANLDFYARDPGASWQHVIVANLLNPVDFDTATFNSAFGAEVEPGVHFSNENIATMNVGTAANRTNWDITPVIQELADGASNNGFILYPHFATNGVGILTTEAGNASPKLVVETSAGTFSFQHGMNGYDGVQDAMIAWIPDPEMGGTNYGTAPGDLTQVNFGSAPTALMDFNDNGEFEAALLRFDNIIGDEEGQIPPDAEVISASLMLTLPNLGNPVTIYEILPHQNTSGGRTINTYFDEKTVTFSNFVDDNNLPQFGLEIGDMVTEFNANSTSISTDVTPSLEKWVADPDQNYGWYLEITQADGVEFFTKESAANTSSPRLTVTFEVETTVQGFSLY